MSGSGDLVQAWDAEPPVGTVLWVGGPGDRITFTRTRGGWLKRQGLRVEVVDYDGSVLFWAPLMVSYWPSVGQAA